MARREKGTGSIWQDNKSKKWKGQIQIGILPNGRPKLKTITRKTRKEVKDELNIIKSEIIAGTYTSASDITIPQISHMLNDNKFNTNVIKPSTYAKNKATIKVIEKSNIAAIPISKLTEYDLNTFLISLVNYSNSIIEKTYAAANSALNKAVKMNIIRYNLLQDMRIPKSKKPTKKVRALTLQEQQSLINALNKDNAEPYRTMLLLSLFTGMRIGEVSALSSESVNFAFKTIKIERTVSRDEYGRAFIGTDTKTLAGQRTLQMNNIVYQLLKSYYDNYFTENADNLFFIRKDKLISTGQVNCYFKRLIVRYGISESDKGFNQHMLRHTFATRSIEAGVPAKVLQHQLGHTDIRVTLNTYCDVFDNYENVYIEQAEKYFIENKLMIN